MEDHKKTLGVFSPNFQGPFQGELFNQIRQLCALKNYKVIGLSTSDFGIYQSKLNLNQLDGAILLRNAISNELASLFIKKSIPVVSIAYDYFPLDIPLICSDHFKGAELAYQYLVKRDHREIAFVGDLSNFDLRKRYEAVCSLCEADGVSTDEALLYLTEDTNLISGIEACKEFILRSCNATGIICGSGLTGIGFHQYLKMIPNIDETHFDIVMFDAIPMTPVLSPEITAIDQNILLMAHKAIEVIDHIEQQKGVERTNYIEPKVILPVSEHDTTSDSYLATCVELSSLYNANYMKSVLTSFHEWSEEIVNTKLDQIMMIAPLFSNLMNMVTLCRIFRDKDGKESMKLMKKFTTTTGESYDQSRQQINCRAENFPQGLMNGDEIGQFDFWVHFDIRVKNKSWGILTVFGHNKMSPKTPANFFSFINYIETITSKLSKQLELKLINRSDLPADNVKKKNDEGDWHVAELRWNSEINLAEWTEEALELIGFTSAIEKNIYKNMDITDRFSEADERVLRKQILDHLLQGKSVSFSGMIKLRSGEKKPAKIESVNGDNTSDDSENIHVFQLAIKE